jgi:hypothetical protein
MEKVSIVQFADAGAKPHAVVVEPHHTIVAVMAVRSSDWPENIAALAKLHFVDESISRNRCICLCLKIENFLVVIF